MAVVEVGGLAIYHETTGDPAAPAVVLIAGLGHQMTWWPKELVDRLVEAGLYVVRLDNRDAGLSGDFGHAGKVPLARLSVELDRGVELDVPYRLADMADDIVGLLDRLRIDAAHLVGASMGGMIAQEVVLNHPDRVLTLTSIMSTTGERGVGVPTREAEARLRTAPPPDIDGYVECSLETARVLHSPGCLDETVVAEAARGDFTRSFRPEGTGRQLAAIWASGDRTDRLSGVDVPTLVVHGELDPLVPIDGGHATAAAIPGAAMMVIADMAHDLPLPMIDQIAAAIVDLTESVAAASPLPDRDR